MSEATRIPNSIDQVEIPMEARNPKLLEIHEVLDHLAEEETSKAEVVKLPVF